MRNRRPWTVLAASLLSLLVLSGISAFGQSKVPPGRMRAFRAEPNVSPPLRHIRPLADKGLPRKMPIRIPHGPGQAAPRLDPVLQDSAGAAVSTTSGLGFDGIGVGLGSYAPSSAPPDTTGDVGDTQYVQWVNTSFAVFDKNTGALLYGPAAGNTLWSGVGGPCEFTNDGDPIVQYDQLAHRWVMTQLAIADLDFGPYYQCVAISTTPDATGPYLRYVWSFDELNDYPKLSVWPNAYLLTFNRFLFAFLFTGASACALERSDMLIGQPAWMICYDVTSQYASLLPGDLDGTMPPAPGSPGLFFNLGTNSVNLWRMQPDFVTPDNTTVVGPINIPVAPFTRACVQNCVPQPGTTQLLDVLGDRPMYRLAYRNFGTHESLVVNHSIVAGSSIGVRWYEIRNPLGTPSVYQQGTFAQDNAYRWMGSMAMDQAGNMAVGYSVASNGAFPSIRHTGREPGDALGTMQGETPIVDGTGSQLPSLNRWGDYSTMSVDAADGCTFWYTNEYLKNSGTFNWSTRITSFRFPGCGAPPPTAPDPPSNLSAATASSSQINLTWSDNSDNEDGFRVERCAGNALFCDANPVNFSQIAELPANSNAYNDSGLSSSSTFSYRVRAFNGVGNSAYSNTAEATTDAPPPPPPTAPNPPSNLSAAAASSSQINLTWTDNSDNEDGFRVERCTGNALFCDANPGNFSQIAELPANSNGYNDPGLSASTTFSYRVRAFNGVGNSAYSSTAEATTDAPPPPPPTAPNPPSNLAAVAGSSGNNRFVNLSWADNSNNEASFILERCQVNKNGVCNFAVIATLAANSVAHTDNSVSRRKTYRYRVKARNAVGDSAYSNTAQVTTP